MLDQYIEELKQKYEEDPIFFECMDKSYNEYYYKYSFCPFCHCLCFAYMDKVACVNKCFIMDILTEEFSEKFEVDNFLDCYENFHDMHFDCNGEIIPIYINHKKKSVYFICTGCDGEILKNVGIFL